jgi:hypothetical protein
MSIKFEVDYGSTIVRSRDEVRQRTWGIDLAADTKHALRGFRLVFGGEKRAPWGQPFMSIPEPGARSVVTAVAPDTKYLQAGFRLCFDRRRE